jgi:phospholipase D1/2
VAISRTQPAYDGRTGVHEIESLYLAIIAAVRHTLYIESQYFASRKLAEAMADRLREPDGPEIVVVNPEEARGWLEEKAMGSARARLLDLVRTADVHQRFRIYTPVTRGGAPIYVHAKIVVMDDRLMRIGSSNLNNRSLGFDTECDLSIEAPPGSPDEAALGSEIAAFRTRLLAEHLDVAPETIDAAIESHGSLIAAIENLRGGGRSLVPLSPPEFGELEEAVLGENDLLDPERPTARWRRLNWLRRA